MTCLIHASFHLEPSLPMLREEVVVAVLSLKAGKSSGVDNVPSELLRNGGEETATVLTGICQKI